MPNPEGIGGKSGKIVEGQNVPQQTTSERLAEEYGVSDKTVKRAGQFAEDKNRPSWQTTTAGGIRWRNDVYMDSCERAGTEAGEKTTPNFPCLVLETACNCPQRRRRSGPLRTIG